MENHYEIVCHCCGKSFWRHNRQKKEFKIKWASKNGGSNRWNEYCSRKCLAEHHNKSIKVNCGWCNKELIQTQAELKRSKSGLSFCDHSCSASYNNTQRRKSRRSKCEIMLFEMLKEKYNDLSLVPNDKEMLNGHEVDIAIPEIRLGIEWNGIVHYKPIYGDKKLSRIKEIDLEKTKVAESLGIRLIVIPDLVSTEKYVRESYFEICKIIDDLKV